MDIRPGSGPHIATALAPAATEDKSSHGGKEASADPAGQTPKPKTHPSGLAARKSTQSLRMEIQGLTETHALHRTFTGPGGPGVGGSAVSETGYLRAGATHSVTGTALTLEHSLMQSAAAGSAAPPGSIHNAPGPAPGPDSEVRSSTRERPPKPGLFSGWLRTASRTISANVPLTASRTTEGGPTRPDVRGPSPRPLGKPAGAKLSPADVKKLSDATAKSISAMGGGVHSPHAPEDPESRLAMVDDVACGHALEAMFRPSTGPLDAAAELKLKRLSLELTRCVPEGGRSTERPYVQALVAGTALHRLTGGDLQAATDLLAAANRVEHPERHVDETLGLKLVSFERLLAATASGAQVLCALRGETEPSRMEALKDAVNIAGEISTQMKQDFGGRDWLGDVMNALDPADHRLEEPIGQPDDPPLQLLGKALRHACAAADGDGDGDGDGSSDSDKAAHLAWRYGFSKSGAGSPFEQMLHNLNDRWSKYVSRSDHGPRTAKNLVREIGHAVLQMVGKHKDPLSQTRFGTMGGDLRPLEEEQGKFVVKLRLAIAPVRERLIRALEDPSLRADPAMMNQCLARIAALDQWADVGRKGFRVDAQDAFQRAQRVRADLLQKLQPPRGDGNERIEVPELSVREFMRALKVRAKLHRNSLPHVMSGESKVAVLGQKLDLAVLEQWAAQAHTSTAGNTVVLHAEWLRESQETWRRRADDLEAQVGALAKQFEQAAPGTSPESGGRPYASVDEPQREQLLKLQRAKLLSLSHDELQQAFWAPTPDTPEGEHRRMTIEAILVARTGVSVGAARAVARAREPDVPLFESRDLVNLATGGAPRQGPSAAHARKVLSKSAGNMDESTVTYADGATHGLNVHAVLGLKSGKGAAVVPNLKALQVESAQVSAGISLTGGRFSVGKTKSREVGGGVSGAFGWGFGKTVAAAFGELSGSRSTARNEMASITARNDVPDWEDKLKEVVDFMFAQVSEKKSKQVFWENFARRFGDDKNVAVSWVIDNPAKVSGGVLIGATVRGGPGSWNVGPSASMGIRREHQRDRRTVGPRMNDVPLAAHSAQTVATASAGLNVGSEPSGAQGGEVGDMLWVSQLVGAAASRIIGGFGAQVAMGRNQDGDLVSTQTQRLNFMKNPGKHVEQVNTRRDEWEAAGVQRSRLNDYLAAVSTSAPQGNRTFGEFVTGQPHIVAELNDYADLLRTLTGAGLAEDKLTDMTPGQQAECEKILSATAHALQREATWKRVALYGVENNALAKTKGINFGAVLARTSSAAGVRLTHLEVAPPALKGRDERPPSSLGTEWHGSASDLPEIEETSTRSSGASTEFGQTALTANRAPFPERPEITPEDLRQIGHFAAAAAVERFNNEFSRDLEPESTRATTPTTPRGSPRESLDG